MEVASTVPPVARGRPSTMLLWVVLQLLLNALWLSDADVIINR